LVNRSPHSGSPPRERQGLPGSWGTPCAHALLSDPGGTSTPGQYGASVRPSVTFRQRRLPRQTPFGAPSHGLDTRCLRFAPGLPQNGARLASGCWPSFAGRDWLPAGFQYRVSAMLTSHPPCPGLPWRTGSWVSGVSYLPLLDCRLAPRIARFKDETPVGPEGFEPSTNGLKSCRS